MEFPLLQGAFAGAAGGLLASAAMTAALAGLRRVLGRPRRVRHPQHSLLRGAPSSAANAQLAGVRDDVTVRLAARLSKRLLGRRLSRREKRWAGPFLHHAFGAAVGAAYGALAERRPRVTAAGGLAFGATVWLVADEIVDPLLGLCAPPWRSPWPVHAWALGSHFVYGGATEGVRRGLRALT